MKHKMYTVWDEVIEAYCSPLLAVNKGHMIRTLTEWAKQKHPLLSNYKDKTLFEMGDYNDETGRLEHYPANKNVGALHELLPNEEINPNTELN